MTTVYIHPTLGDDSRSYAQAQNTATPWKNGMKALTDSSVVDGDVIRIGRPGDGTLTWLNADAVIDSKGAAGTATNVSKAVTWLVSSGVTAVFQTERDAAYLPGSYGNSLDTEGPDSHTVRGHGWRFINPKADMRMLFNTEAGASIEIKQTGTPPTQVGGGYSSAIYLVNKSGQAGTSGRVQIRGLVINGFDGNGLMANGVPAPDARYCDISHTMTGVRWEGAACSGIGNSTLLNGAVSAGASSLVVDSTAGWSVGDLLRVGGGALDRDTEFRAIAVIDSSTQVSLAPGPSGRIGLHYAHADNTAVASVFGLFNSRVHHNDMYGLDNLGFGAEGVSFNKLPHDVVMWRCQSDNNFGQYVMGGYGIDGGTATPYKQGDNCTMTECDMFDSHSLIESGTQGRTDGAKFIFTFNRAWGKIDQQAIFGNQPTASVLHARCVPGLLMRRNSIAVTNGNLTHGGIRFQDTGDDSVDPDSVYICENIIVFYGWDAQWLSHEPDDQFPTNSTIDRNLFCRIPAGSDPGASHHNGTTYAASESGRAQYNAATGFEANSKWAVDPKFVDPFNGDLRLQSDSPARGMAANGDDIGALDFEQITGVTQYAVDAFERSVTDSWGNADTGGAWTRITGAVSQMDVG